MYDKIEVDTKMKERNSRMWIVVDDGDTFYGDEYHFDDAYGIRVDVENINECQVRDFCKSVFGDSTVEIIHATNWVSHERV